MVARDDRHVDRDPKSLILVVADMAR